MADKNPLVIPLAFYPATYKIESRDDSDTKAAEKKAEDVGKRAMSQREVPGRGDVRQVETK